MSQSRISLKEVTKVYNKQVILNKLTFDFKDELYVLQGINGSGKSTLVKSITNIVNITKGVINVNGKVCYLPEKFELPRNMTSYQILKMYKKDKKEIQDILTQWEIPNKRLNSLSKGNFQKLGIALMVIQNVEIYIFDEPTDSLDVDIIKVFKSAIKLLKEKNKCIIVILHQLSIDELSPIKVTMNGGELCLN
ncbi:MAG: ATP-binding cassette domain-containing protein [bacterium]